MLYRPIPALVFLVLLVLLVSGAGATTARIEALGGLGDCLEDDANVLRWYGSLADYPDLAVLESGHFHLNHGYRAGGRETVSGPGAGIHSRLGRFGTGALYWHGKHSDADPGELLPSELENTVTALFARAVAGVQVGLAFRYGSLDSKFLDPDALHFLPEEITKKNRRIDVGAGVRFDVNERTYVDVAGEVRLLRLDEYWRTPLDRIHDDERESGGTYALRARAFRRLTQNSALVVHSEYQQLDAPVPVTQYGEVPAANGEQVRVGTGWNWFPDPDRFLLARFEYLYGESSVDSQVHFAWPYSHGWDVKWSSYRAGLAAESRLLPWLSLRAAWDWQYRSRTETYFEPIDVWSGLAPAEAEGAVQFLQLGLGAHLGRYDLDLAVGEGLPTEPGGHMGTRWSGEAQDWITITLRAGI